MSHEGQAVFATCLWDLLPGRPERTPQGPQVAQGREPAAVTLPSAKRPRQTPAQDRYDQLVRRMKDEHDVRVRKWRRSSSGCAWQVSYADGRLVRLIEAPYPRGPISAAIFLHEVGHHAIGFHRYKPRCYEEYMAWRWALAAMLEHGIVITPRVERRVRDSLRYAVAKARRRGIKRLPQELMQYAH